MNYKKEKFDLAKALTGAEVVTKLGTPVKIVSHNTEISGRQNVAAWIGDDLYTWWEDGKFTSDKRESVFDLYLLEPNENIGFINIHEDSHGRWADERIYDFYKVAVENGKLSPNYKGTIEIVCP
jgi:hypothetical protein